MKTNETFRNNRRGVTLLLVLALMAMFAMLVISFMIVTTQAKNAADTTALAILNPREKSTADVSTITYEALDALLIGGLDQAIGPHGLLENLYGHPASDGFQGASGVFGTLSCDTNNTYLIYNQGYFGSAPFDVASGSFLNMNVIGKVVTVTSIPDEKDDKQRELKGKSTFVLEMNGSGVALAPFPVSFGVAAQRTALNGCGFIVNSPAFSGTGPGYVAPANSGDPALTGADGDDVPLVLRPNAMAPDSDGTRSYRNHLQSNLTLMNPDYTAPDLLNMFLAWYDVDGTKINGIIPSFHRPQLVRYHASSDHDMIRKIVLRPSPYDHPDFTGSNLVAVQGSFYPASAGAKSFLTDGPWDVDGDGDGIADSIWLDVGLRPWTDGSTGKVYKPLAAFLVLDMDGRLNVNTHGNVLHTVANFDTVSGVSTNGGVEVRGSGAGPAEIRLDKGLDTGKLQALLFGNEGKKLAGRYGSTEGGNNPAPGKDDGSDATVWENGFDYWRRTLWNRSGINPTAYGYSSADQAMYGGLRPDWWGQAALAFDPLGNRFPMYHTNLSGLYGQNPYLVNPYGDTPASEDDPFGAETLQFLLRMPGDGDYTNLPTRLRELLGETISNPAASSAYRFRLTTRSSDIPSPSYYVAGHTSLFHMIRSAAGSDDKAEAILEMLPEELRRGEKINLNRLTTDPYWIPTTDAERRYILKEKARFAQGIYLLLMTLCHDRIGGGYSEGGTSFSYDQVATRLAQWAVNLVDFMDPDAIMTPLVFNTQPFSDATDYVSQYSDNPSNDLLGSITFGGNVRVVWGMERPEVALTKTFATHNLRIADSTHNTQTNDDEAAIAKKFHEKKDVNYDNQCEDGCGKHLYRVSKACNGKECSCSAKHDEDFDQVLISQGSLFLELYRQGDPNRMRYMPDLYDDDNKLNLAKQVNGTGTSYVWRLAVSAPTRTDDKNDVFDALDSKALEYTFQPKQETGDADSGKLSVNCDVTFERFIFFGTDSSSTSIDRNNSYYNYGSPGDNSDANVRLEPNEYLVIGPRLFTSFKSKPVKEGEKGVAAGADDTTHFGTPDKTNDGNHIDLSSLSGSGKTPKVMIAAATVPAGWSATDEKVGFVLPGAGKPGIGVSVSEPLLDSYYPEPQGEASPEMIAAMNPGGGTPVSFKDNYCDTDSANSPLDKDSDLFGFGTIPRYKSIFLQRLADPTREYDPLSNPYITVDWNMIDLHVFNSESDENSDQTNSGNNLFNDNTTDKDLDFNGSLYFAARQWGATATLADDPTFPNIWDRTFDMDTIEDDKAGLGNTKTHPELNGDTEFGRLLKYNGKGPANSVSLPDGTTDAVYDGAPEKAWQHYAWHDAPLSNTFELMQVPATSASRFGFECRDNRTVPTLSTIGSFGINGRFGYKLEKEDTPKIGPYLNFFGDSLDLARFLEFVRVPSRFAGTIRNWTEPDGTIADGDYYPPKPIYAMREPGKINLNTTTESAWEALKGNRSDWPTYTALKQMRDGSGASPPTAFAEPFRSPNAANLVPTAGMTVRKSVETTILRDDAVGVAAGTDSNAANQYTLLENIQRLSDLTTSRSNVFAVWVTIGYFEVDQYTADTAGVTQMWKDHFPDRGTPGDTDVAFFRAVYPDGCVLKKEKGLADGTVKRNRSFFLIDRSIPVGFRRGEPLPDAKGRPSVRNVIVLERPLE